MIFLKYFGLFSAIFAKQNPKGLFKKDFLNETFTGFMHGNFFGQPKFNESCDADSQNAARECEDWV